MYSNNKEWLHRQLPARGNKLTEAILIPSFPFFMRRTVESVLYETFDMNVHKCFRGQLRGVDVYIHRGAIRQQWWTKGRTAAYFPAVQRQLGLFKYRTIDYYIRSLFWISLKSLVLWINIGFSESDLLSRMSWWLWRRRGRKSNVCLFCRRCLPIVTLHLLFIRLPQKNASERNLSTVAGPTPQPGHNSGGDEVIWWPGPVTGVLQCDTT